MSKKRAETDDVEEVAEVAVQPKPLVSIQKSPPKDASDDVAFVRQLCEEAKAQVRSPDRVKVVIRREGLEATVREILPSATVAIDNRLGPPAVWRRMMAE